MMTRFKQIYLLGRARYWLLCVLGLMLTACGKAPSYKRPTVGYKDCWPCATYETTFDAIQKSLTKLVDLTATNAMVLLGLCLLFWLLFHVGKFLVTIREPNTRKFIFPITNTLFKATIVAVLLSNPNGGEHCLLVDFVGDLISPTMDFFAHIASTILDSNTIVKDATQAAATEDVGGTLAENMIFKDSARVFLDIIFRIYVALKVGISLGFAIWSASNPSGWLMGVLIICMFWMLLLVMPISLLDAIVRIMATVILAPFALVGWVFPPTKWMLKRLWGVLFAASLNLMFIAFYIAVTVYVLMMFAEKAYPGILGDAVQANDPKLVIAVQSMDTGLIGFFVLVLCLNKLSTHIFKFANQLGGESVEGSFIRVIQGFKKLAIAAGKLAIAAAFASPTVAKEALRDAKNLAKDIAQHNGQGGGG